MSSDHREVNGHGHSRSSNANQERRGRRRNSESSDDDEIDDSPQGNGQQINDGLPAPRAIIPDAERRAILHPLRQVVAHALHQHAPQPAAGEAPPPQHTGTLSTPFHRFTAAESVRMRTMLSGDRHGDTDRELDPDETEDRNVSFLQQGSDILYPEQNAINGNGHHSTNGVEYQGTNGAGPLNPLQVAQHRIVEALRRGGEEEQGSDRTTASGPPSRTQVAHFRWGRTLGGRNDRGSGNEGRDSPDR